MTIIDWASRAVLAWRLSNTMDVSFCLSALEEALANFGKPEIFNSDQGSQFTSAAFTPSPKPASRAFTGTLAEAGVTISMDGRGRWMDNVFIERLWRSLKYEDVYLKGYADGREAARGIAEWIAFYNDRRPDQALADRMPMVVWREGATGATAVDMVDNASALPAAPGAGTNEMRMSAAESAPGAAWHAKGCYESRMCYAVGEKSDPERLRCSRISLAN